MSLSQLSVRRPVTTYMAVLIVLVLGAVSYFKIPVELMPEITFPTVTINTQYENVNPQEIETLVTEPIEKAVSSVEGVEEVSSVSVEGRSQIRVSFAWGTDLDGAMSDLREKIDQWETFSRETEDAKLLLEMAIEEGKHYPDQINTMRYFRACMAGCLDQ